VLEAKARSTAVASAELPFWIDDFNGTASGTREVRLARERLARRIVTVVRIRSRRSIPADETIAEEKDGIGEVLLAVVVAVGSRDARDEPATAEESIENRDDVGEIGVAVVVRIASMEERWGLRQKLDFHSDRRTEATADSIDAHEVRDVLAASDEPVAKIDRARDRRVGDRLVGGEPDAEERGCADCR